MAKPSRKTGKAHGERKTGTLADAGLKRALVMPPAGNATKSKRPAKKGNAQKPR